MNNLLNVVGVVFNWKMVELLAVLVVFGMLALTVLDSLRARQDEKRKQYRKERELARQVKLQNKIDEFEAYKTKVEQIKKDMPKVDEGYLNAKIYFSNRGNVMKNIRVTLQDYTVASVLELYDAI